MAQQNSDVTTDAAASVMVRRGIVYSSLPGYRPLELDLYLPRGTAQALCLYLHGGGWLRGSRADGPGPVSPISHRLLEQLAAHGLAVASASYRLSGEARFPAQLDDVAAACSFLNAERGTFGFGEAPLVLFGVSAGGHLAALHALTPEASPPVAACACWYAPTDLAALPDDMDAVAPGRADRGPGSREARLLGAPAATADLARRASPARVVRPGAPPFLLVHGDADQDVPSRQSTRLGQALAAVGTPARLEFLPGYPHTFAGMPGAELEHWVAETARFLLASAVGRHRETP